MVIHEIGKLKFDLEFAKAQYLPEPKMLIAEKPQARNVDTRDCAEPKRSKKCKARACRNPKKTKARASLMKWCQPMNQSIQIFDKLSSQNEQKNYILWKENFKRGRWEVTAIL